VPGGGVDSAHFAAVAGVLADEFRTVTYDRRGYARSPRPAGWTSTTIGEQADDLAGLIEVLGLAPAVVWGSSLGGVVLLDLLVRRPDLLRLGVVHEPPLFTVLPDGDRMVARLEALAGRATRPDTVHTAMRDHAHEVLGDDFDRLPPELRERMYANASVFFGVEVPGLVGYLHHVGPLTHALGHITVPVRVMASAEGRDQPVHRVSRWLADRLGVRLDEIGGGHMPYATRPEQTAATIRAAIHQRPFHPGSDRRGDRSAAS
jgi:pimeloyl-ACP methyl ester carboxylesterase